MTVEVSDQQRRLDTADHEVRSLLAETFVLKDLLRAVLDIHQPETNRDGTWCSVCEEQFDYNQSIGFRYPCPTALAAGVKPDAYTTHPQPNSGVEA